MITLALIDQLTDRDAQEGVHKELNSAENQRLPIGPAGAKTTTIPSLDAQLTQERETMTQKLIQKMPPKNQL